MLDKNLSSHSFGVVPLVTRVQIENYKSIEKLDFEARRVTVFIGEPNAGKSNILEALALLSPGIGSRFLETFRAEHPAELFRDQSIELQPLLALQSAVAWQLQFDPVASEFRLSFNLAGEQLTSSFGPTVPAGQIRSLSRTPFRYYSYRRELFANGREGDYHTLSCPYGENLPAVLISNKTLRQSIAALFKKHGHRLEIRPQSMEILMSKEVDDFLYSYPFSAVSETLRRIAFYEGVFETNRDAVLILDEPEAYTYLFYTKYLAARIALDESNQFFLTTHNPYVLMSIIEKTPSANLAIYATRMRNYRTELHRLDEKELDEALDLNMDLFLNLDRYFPNEDAVEAHAARGNGS